MAQLNSTTSTTPTAAASTPAAKPGKKGAKPGKKGAKAPAVRDEMQIVFERYARGEKVVQQVNELVAKWPERVPSTEPHHNGFKTLAKSLAKVEAALAEARTAFGALAAAGAKAPKIARGLFAIGDLIKYKPDQLKKALEMGGDPKIWGGTWKVTQVFKKEAGAALVMGVNVETGMGIGPFPVYYFVRA